METLTQIKALLPVGIPSVETWKQIAAESLGLTSEVWSYIIPVKSKVQHRALQLIERFEALGKLPLSKERSIEWFEGFEIEDDVEDITLINVTAERIKNSPTTAHGIDIHTHTTSYVRNIRVINPQIIDVKSAGIYVWSMTAYETHDVYIQGGTIRNVETGAAFRKASDSIITGTWIKDYSFEKTSTSTSQNITIEVY